MNIIRYASKIIILVHRPALTQYAHKHKQRTYIMSVLMRGHRNSLELVISIESTYVGCTASSETKSNLRNSTTSIQNE